MPSNHEKHRQRFNKSVLATISNKPETESKPTHCSRNFFDINYIFVGPDPLKKQSTSDSEQFLVLNGQLR